VSASCTSKRICFCYGFKCSSASKCATPSSACPTCHPLAVCATLHGILLHALRAENCSWLFSQIRPSPMFDGDLSVQALTSPQALQAPPKHAKWRAFAGSEAGSPTRFFPPTAATLVPSPPRRTSSRLRSGATSAYAARSLSVAEPSAEAVVPAEALSQSGEQSAAELAPSTSSLSLYLEDPLHKEPLHPGVLTPRHTPNEAHLLDGAPPVSTIGWGAQAVASSWGLHAATRHLAVAMAYYQTPLAAAARLGALATHQEALLQQDFLASCKGELDKVCITPCCLFSLDCGLTILQCAGALGTVNTQVIKICTLRCWKWRALCAARRTATDTQRPLCHLPLRRRPPVACPLLPVASRFPNRQAARGSSTTCQIAWR
jgi:hypothetical protein